MGRLLARRGAVPLPPEDGPVVIKFWGFVSGTVVGNLSKVETRINRPNVPGKDSLASWPTLPKSPLAVEISRTWHSFVLSFHGSSIQSKTSRRVWGLNSWATLGDGGRLRQSSVEYDVIPLER
jgi:hypothetical protein